MHIFGIKYLATNLILKLRTGMYFYVHDENGNLFVSCVKFSIETFKNHNFERVSDEIEISSDMYDFYIFMSQNKRVPCPFKISSWSHKIKQFLFLTSIQWFFFTVYSKRIVKSNLHSFTLYILCFYSPRHYKVNFLCNML